MESIQEKFKREGIVHFHQKDHSGEAYQKLGQYFFGSSKISDETTIQTSWSKTSQDPYLSKKELQVHSEGIGKFKKNIYGILVTIHKKPQIGGESTFVFTPDIIKELPESFHTLKYSFKYANMDSIEDLIYNHPIKKTPILNFTTLWYDPDTGASQYIKFLGCSEQENREILLLLHNLIEKYKFSIPLKESETVVFDNFLFLHGRAEYSGERIVKRFEVYL